MVTEVIVMVGCLIGGFMLAGLAAWLCTDATVARVRIDVMGLVGALVIGVLGYFFIFTAAHYAKELRGERVAAQQQSERHE